MLQDKPRGERSSLSAPLAWLGMWGLNAVAFGLLLNALFSLHLGQLTGWGRPGTTRFSQMVFTVLAMATLMLNSARRGRAARAAPAAPGPRSPQTAWDLSWRATAALLGVILIGVAYSRQPVVPDWWELGLSLAGFYGVAALAFWWHQTMLPPPPNPDTSTKSLLRDPFLTRPAHGVLVFRRPRWMLVFWALMFLVFAAPAIYLANALAHGMPGTRLSPVAGFGCLLFYGSFALLMLLTGADMEVYFDLRDRTCRQTRVMWGIRQGERVSSLNEIAGLRLCQTYSTRNSIWVQIVWRDPGRPAQALTPFRDADVAREQIRSLAETLDLAVLPSVFEPRLRAGP